MGSGIIEAEKFRSERFQIDVRTSDPESTSETELWIRSDIAPDTDQIATLRVDHGSGKWDIPIYSLDTSKDSVSESVRVQVGGTEGYIPLIATDDAEYAPLRYQQESETLAFHDARGLAALFDVAIVSTNSPITAGETLDVDYTVENDGEFEATQDIDLEDFNSLVVDTDTVTLSGSESQSGTLNWPTSDDDAGEDNITVRSSDTSVSTLVSIESAIPDSGMFQNPLYQYTATEGLNVSDGATATDWTEQLAGVGDATAVGGPTYRSDQSGFGAVEYDGNDDGHDIPTDSQLPTGTDPVSFAATIYMKGPSGSVIGYGSGSTGNGIVLYFNSRNEIELNIWGKSSPRGGSPSTGQRITVGGAASQNDQEVYLNGSSVGTGTLSYDLSDANHSIGYRGIDSNLWLDGYIYDIVLCDGRESDQAFADYHNDRLGS